MWGYRGAGMGAIKEVFAKKIFKIGINFAEKKL